MIKKNNGHIYKIHAIKFLYELMQFNINIMQFNIFNI